MPGKNRACITILHCNAQFALLFCVKGKLLQQTQRCLIITMKDHAKFGPKHNPAFQMISKKNGQFLSSFRKGSKFQIWLLSFVWKVNCLNQKTFVGVLVSDTEGPCRVWPKTESCFTNKHKKNWSISFQQPKRIQIRHFIPYLKSKLPELKNLQRSFILWHWRAMQSLGQNWILFPNQPQNSWSISIQRSKSLQISDLIPFFCLKSKLP